jgi:hypothetical protein
MAQRALGSGAPVRRRALFGLVDRDGWAWAGVKAMFWFLLIILLMGYLPDRAYYFTVFSQIDLGLRSDALTPVNFCPPENETLPCPAPVGAILPWQLSPKELLLPAPRRDGVAVQIGTNLLYIGGTDGQKPAATVYRAVLYSNNGNFSAWREGPALPAPRTRLAAGFFGGSIFAIGGDDASGKPTDTVYVLTPDPKTGDLGTWRVADGTVKDVPKLTLPGRRAGASFVAAADGLVVIGGRDEKGPTETVWKSTVDAKGALQPWQAQTPLVPGQPRADASAVLSGDVIFVYGGVDAKGPTSVVMRGDIGKDKDLGKVVRWGTPTNASANLPAPRTDAAGFTANGAIYLAGGTDGRQPKTELWWTTPDGSGNIIAWQHLSQTDLPAGQGLAGGSAIASGANAFVIGGQSPGGVQNASIRTNLAPKPPFFQVGGPLGLTVPALKIDGEIGQQIGYLNAAGVATVNFVLLLLIGWAMAHKEQTLAMWRRIRRRGSA